MHQWIDVFDKGDYRYILKEYDENVSTEELTPYFDVLIQEYEEIGGTDEYSHNLAKIDSKMWKQFIIRACTVTATALRYGLKEDAKLIIQDFNLKIKVDDNKLIDRIAIEKLERKIKQIQSAIKVNEIEDAEENKRNKRVIWEDLIVYIDKVLGTKIDYNCPVALYLSYAKAANAIITAKSKQNG